mgnify:CR=1 FL=1
MPPKYSRGQKAGRWSRRWTRRGCRQEILIMDTKDMATAKKVWRWNMGGFGYSSNGINGPYETAITMDGHIVGKFITAFTIIGSQIIAGRIQSKDGSVYFDLDSAELTATKLIAPFLSGQKIEMSLGTNPSDPNARGLSLNVGGKPLFRSMWERLPPRPLTLSQAQGIVSNFSGLTRKAGVVFLLFPSGASASSVCWARRV